MAKLIDATNCCLIHPILQIWPPCDFYLFPNIKKWLRGKRFASNKEIIAETEAYFKEFDQSYFLNGIKIWNIAGLNVSS